MVAVHLFFNQSDLIVYVYRLDTIELLNISSEHRKSTENEREKSEKWIFFRLSLFFTGIFGRQHISVAVILPSIYY